MARELVLKEIDGRNYEFQQFGAKQSTKLLLRLFKILGEPLSLAMASAFGDSTPDKKLLERDLKPELLVQAVTSLTQKLDENEVMDLIETFTAKDNVLCDGIRVNFDSHYEAKLEHMFKVLGAALEVQYGNFLSALTGMQRLVRRPVTNQAPVT